jgi:glycine betaine/proline transport system ATP-binding protein
LAASQVRDRFGCVVGVAGVDFSVPYRRIFCVMGLSGSGKSTLIRHINRLIEPTAGAVVVDGRVVNDLTQPELRQFRAKTVGMVFQNMALFPHKTVLDNVAFGLDVQKIPRKDRYKIAEEKLALVKLDGWGAKYPDELSGGMQQRVGLARALAADPQILLMDEPFSALDPLIRRELQDEFIKLSRDMNKTTLFITHDLDEAIRLGDQIAIMNEGKFVQIGAPAEIILAPADEYVRRFVESVSPLPFLSARDLMQQPRPGDEVVDGCTIDAAASLDSVLSKACVSEKPLAVVDHGSSVGIITKNGILQRVRIAARLP